MNFDILKTRKENKIIKDNKADFAVLDHDYIELSNSRKIDLTQRKIAMSPLTVGFIEYLINDNNFKKLKSNFYNDNKNVVKVCIIKNNELDVVTEFSKVDIVNALKVLNDDNLLDDDAIRKFNELKELITFDKLLENIKDLNIEYNDNRYSVKNIITILSKEPDSFLYTIESGSLGLNGSNLCKLIYKYIFDSKIETKYYLTDNMYKNISYIKDLNIYYYGEILLNDKPKYFNQIKINKKFKDRILSNLPSNFSLLEKVFYIYYLLCTKLVYDEEQMVNDNFSYNDYSIDHTKLSRISKIDENNNRVLCFEFNAIFAKLLEELGINYELTGEEKYAKGHVGLRFLVDDFIISADSTLHGVVYSDMAHAKNNIKLEGFHLVNEEDEEVLEKYNNAISNVYGYIEEKNNFEIDKFDEKIKKYKDLIDSHSILSDSEKLEIFLDKVNKCTLYSSDKVEYYLTLKKALFEKDILDVYFVKNNAPNNKKFMIQPIIIIVYKDIVSSNLTSYRYFIQEENEQVREISFSNLKSKFNNKKYEYSTDKFRIPGIERRR